MSAGTLVAVVGASGVGKDSLLARARLALDDDSGIRFVRRVITRESDRHHEPHDSVDVATFQRLQRRGQFAVCWSAHGLHYGVPVSCRDDLARGRVVVVNGSRAALPQFVERFDRLHVIEVTVPPDVLANRLRARSRESDAEIAARLARRVDLSDFDGSIERIDNTGPLEVAAGHVVDRLRALVIERRRHAAPPAM